MEGNNAEESANAPLPPTNEPEVAAVEPQPEAPIEPVNNQNEVEDTPLAPPDEQSIPDPEGDIGQEEMDPLVLTDGPDPELQFEESDEDSPGASRCRTRRSNTRNIPTPKTPKSVTPPDPITPPAASNPPTPPLIRHEESPASTSGTSRGQDIEPDNSLGLASEEMRYMSSLRFLSPRQTIRPLSDSYRQQAFAHNIQGLPGPSTSSAGSSTGPSSSDASSGPSASRKRRRSVSSLVTEDDKRTRSDAIGGPAPVQDANLPNGGAAIAGGRFNLMDFFRRGGVEPNPNEERPPVPPNARDNSAGDGPAPEEGEGEDGQPPENTSYCNIL